MEPTTTGQRNRLQGATTDMGKGITQIEAHGYTAELDNRGRVLRMTSLGYGAISSYSVNNQLNAQEIKYYGEFCGLIWDKSEELYRAFKNRNWSKR